jgi:hypothetical protein
VLVAQSQVGREGLNLHESCRIVIQFHAEWNPAVLEQQIGRVDRKGSRWEQLAQAWLEGRTEGPILTKLLSPDAPTDSIEVLETIKTLLRLRELACEWARDAAPFVHPRLAAVAHRYEGADGKLIGPTIIQQFIDQREPEAPALAETGPGVSDRRH